MPETIQHVELKSKILDNVGYTKSLKDYVKSTKQSMRLAIDLSVYAWNQFEAHGNLQPAQAFLDAIREHGKNYVRASAFVKWLTETSPAILVAPEVGTAKTKLVKDHDDEGHTAKPFDRSKALAKPFWDYAPDKEMIFFTQADILDRLESMVAQFQNTKSRQPASPAAAALVAKVANFATMLRDQNEKPSVQPEGETKLITKQRGRPKGSTNKKAKADTPAPVVAPEPVTA